MNIGCHLSISRGFENTIKVATDICATTVQFFTRNPRGGNAKKISESDVAKFHDIFQKSNVKPLVGHLPYTVNAASPTKKTWEFACRVILEDLIRMDNLGVNYLVMHPGSFSKGSVIEGLERIITALDIVFSLYSGSTILCLETMSGKGTEIGRSLDEIAAIINGLGNPSHLGVCLDSCHLFAAGYNIRMPSEVNRLVNEIEDTIGMNNVYLSHLNDSQMDCGSNKDRHECIGQGKIGNIGIYNYLTHKALKNLPFILETPVDNEIYYGHEIAHVHSILK